MNEVELNIDAIQILVQHFAVGKSASNPSISTEEKLKEEHTSSGIEVIDEVQEYSMRGLVSVPVKHLVCRIVNGDPPRVQIHGEEAAETRVHCVVDLVTNRVVDFCKEIKVTYDDQVLRKCNTTIFLSAIMMMIWKN